MIRIQNAIPWQQHNGRHISSIPRPEVACEQHTNHYNMNGQEIIVFVCIMRNINENAVPVRTVKAGPNPKILISLWVSSVAA